MVRGPGRLPARSQGLVFLLLTVSFLVGAWRTWLEPERLLRESRQSRLTTARAELARLQQATVGLPALRREIRSLEARLAAATSTRRDRGIPDQILDPLNEAATASGVRLTTFSTATAQGARGDSADGRRIQIGLEGGFHGVVAFLRHLVALEGLGSVHDIAIASAAKPEGRQTVSATVVAAMSSAAPPIAVDEVSVSRGRDPFLDASSDGDRGGRAATGHATAAAAPLTGLAGVAVDQVIVTGIVRAEDGVSAVLQAPDRRTFVARLHDRLLDATIVSIDPAGVTFAGLPGRGASPPLRKPLGNRLGAVR